MTNLSTAEINELFDEAAEVARTKLDPKGTQKSPEIVTQVAHALAIAENTSELRSQKKKIEKQLQNLWMSNTSKKGE